MQAQRPAIDEEAALEAGVDEIIAEHNGDARAAIRSLLEQISYLELARNRALDLVSFGYARENHEGR